MKGATIPKKRYIGLILGIYNNIGLLTTKAQIENMIAVIKSKGTTTKVIIRINGINIMSPTLELFSIATWGNRIPNK